VVIDAGSIGDCPRMSLIASNTMRIDWLDRRAHQMPGNFSEIRQVIVTFQKKILIVVCVGQFLTFPLIFIKKISIITVR
jgi:hypothetical protein